MSGVRQAARQNVVERSTGVDPLIRYFPNDEISSKPTVRREVKHSSRTAENALERRAEVLFGLPAVLALRVEERKTLLIVERIHREHLLNWIRATAAEFFAQAERLPDALPM